MVVVGIDNENNPIFAHQSNTPDYMPNITLKAIYDKQQDPKEDKIEKMTVIRLKNYK